MSERSFGRRPFDFLNCSTFARTFSLDLRLDELQPTTTTPSTSVRTKSSGHFMVQKRYANINSRSSSTSIGAIDYTFRPRVRARSVNEFNGDGTTVSDEFAQRLA